LSTQFTTNTQNTLQENQYKHGHVGLSQDFNCPEATVNGSTVIKNALVKCLFTSNWRWIY